MKLSKSKLDLAKAINENGGWVEPACFSAQDADGEVFHYSAKPTIGKGCKVWHHRGCIGVGEFMSNKLANWHQTIISREEYYQAYPMADADGWIEWKGGECPVEKGTLIDVKYANGVTNFGVSALTSTSDYNHKQGTCASFLATNWNSGLPMSGIVAYRLHKPEVKPEFCESLTRSIQEPASSSTIEHLAQDYRNAKDYAERLQKEADEAKVKAGAALGKLERAGEAAGLVVSPIREDKNPELSITDWRDLKVGDEVEAEHYEMKIAGVIEEMESVGYEGERPVRIKPYYESAKWCTSSNVKLIRRP